MKDRGCLTRAKRAQLAGFSHLNHHNSAYTSKFEKLNAFLDGQIPPLSIETTFGTIATTHLELFDFS